MCSSDLPEVATADGQLNNTAPTTIAAMPNAIRLSKFSLNTTHASRASLLLNAEAVLTALLAWVVFKENFDKRIALGMVAIVAGAVLLSWPSAVATIAAIPNAIRLSKFSLNTTHASRPVGNARQPRVLAAQCRGRADSPAAPKAAITPGGKLIAGFFNDI